jgi:hypothetical protein
MKLNVKINNDLGRLFLSGAGLLSLDGILSNLRMLKTQCVVVIQNESVHVLLPSAEWLAVASAAAPRSSWPWPHRGARSPCDLLQYGSGADNDSPDHKTKKKGANIS